MSGRGDEHAATDAAAREEMIQTQLVGRGVRDARVLDAMRAVPRAPFVPSAHRHLAYSDRALPAGEGQTISQPYIVARMLEALELDAADRVLEVGTGTGYAAGVLSRIAAEVYTVERNERLVDAARRRLAHIGADNVYVRHGDGTLGWPQHAPYDGVVVTAGGPEVPRALVDQLGAGGRLLIPVGSRDWQTLIRLRRGRDGSLRREHLEEVVFVPLIGSEGWREDSSPPPV